MPIYMAQASLLAILLLQSTGAATGYFTTLPPGMAWFGKLSITGYILRLLLKLEFAPWNSYTCQHGTSDGLMGSMQCVHSFQFRACRCHPAHMPHRNAEAATTLWIGLVCVAFGH